MKKLLAMVLALVMTLSLATVGTNAFKDDAAIKADYNEAVQVLNGMGVFKGYPDGEFKPLNDITRAEVAAIVYRIYTQDVDDKQAGVYAGYGNFSDVSNSAWYAGYIGYCTNAGFIKGYGDGKFGPNDKVTGYQALAMILRAVGYGKNAEFEGKDWELHVAQVAQQVGALKNVTGESLKTAASRQLVAELLFQCLQVPQVTYTAAFGYAPVTLIADKGTLGDKFKLKANDDEDAFGRPAKTWTYNTGNEETSFPKKALATYTVMVDECDIAKDLGISAAKNIEKAYIDGEVITNTSTLVTSNGVATINPMATRSYVGAQGRLTEVYKMGTAYRIVEINTYLAQVTKVTAETTDKNGHKTNATVDLVAYMGFNRNEVTATFKGYKATGYKVGDYVLVTIANPNGAKAAVKSIEAAPVVAGGELTGYTLAAGLKPAAHVFGKISFNDADKFFLNIGAGTGAWSVLTDKYGNAIGLVKDATNYLVIERIEWKQNTSAIGGYALANLVLADGTKVAGATVSTIGRRAASNTGDTDGSVRLSTVSDYFKNNAEYYGHIFTYSVNENGTYNVTPHGQEIIDMDGATIVKGKATIANAVNNVVATDKTVFLLADSKAIGTTYTAYVGKNNVPSVKEADICVLTDTKGYATLVVVSAYEDASNKFIAYVTDDKAEQIIAKEGPAFDVYKLGETAATRLIDTDDYFDDRYQGTGLYGFEVDSDGYILNMRYLLPDLQASSSGNIQTYGQWDADVNRMAVKAAELGSSFQVYSYSSLQEAPEMPLGYTFHTNSFAAKDFSTTADTKVIFVTKTALDGTASLSEGTMADVDDDAVVFVSYTKKGTNNYVADVIYVFENTGFTPVVVNKYAANVESYTADTETGFDIVLGVTKNGRAFTDFDLEDITLDVDVINQNTGFGLYSTDLDVSINEEGEIVIHVNALPIAGDYYYATGSLKIDGISTTMTFKTPVKQATTTAPF